MKLRYTPRAAAELADVLSYIERWSPQGAQNVKARVETVIDILRHQPGSGRLTRNPRLRRTNASPYPYVIFYEVLANEVVIIGVRHGARSPASMPGGH